MEFYFPETVNNVETTACKTHQMQQMLDFSDAIDARRAHMNTEKKTMQEIKKQRES